MTEREVIHEPTDRGRSVPDGYLDDGPGAVQEPIRFGDPYIIDAGITMMHDAFGVKLPVLIAVGAIPLTGIVVVLIGKSDRYAVTVKMPKAL
jgi:hypothetical protein